VSKSKAKVKLPSDFKALRKVIRKHGWYLERTGKHEVWRCDCGEHQVALPVTPSENRGVKNKVAEIRRTECPTLQGVLR